MQMIIKPIAGFLLASSAFAFYPKTKETKPKKTEITAPKISSQKIQVAILLDVSSSMDGLIGQAKTQLWNMVNTLGKVKCDNDAIPNIEIALYEYGRTTNNANEGFVKQLKPFTKSLDSLSMMLFNLTTNGGDEFCGHAIYKAIDELQWDEKSNNYKVIFIAGNEDFLQGSLHYSKACSNAKNKGVIVNTIYCGDKQQGIREHWNLQAECGNGSFTNIDANIKEVEIPTPYDTVLYALNTRLNGTYLTYGRKSQFAGAASKINQKAMDDKNFEFSANAGFERVKAKAQQAVYNNSTWDIVDANRTDSTFFKKLNKDFLPDSLKSKSISELKVIAVNNQKSRDSISTKILEISNLRNEFIKNNKPKNATPTLETEVEKIIKQQVIKSNMKLN